MFGNDVRAEFCGEIGEKMYTFESKVRFSEVDSTQLLTLPAIINYFQDCSTMQSEELGAGIDVLRQNGKGWILSSWQIEVERYPMLGEKLYVDTWPISFEKFYGYRNFQLRTENDEVLVKTYSIWVYMDFEKGRPSRVEEEVISNYILEPALSMEPVSRKIGQPKELEVKGIFPVLRHQIDVNGHVNNCQYIQVALEVLPECGRAKKIRVEYKKSAKLGDTFVPKIAIEEERKVVELCKADGDVFAIVEMRD